MEFQSIHNGLICPSVTISNVTEVTNSIDVIDEVCLEKSLHSKFNVSYKIVLSSFDFSTYEASTDGILQLPGRIYSKYVAPQSQHQGKERKGLIARGQQSEQGRRRI